MRDTIVSQNVACSSQFSRRKKDLSKIYNAKLKRIYQEWKNKKKNMRFTDAQISRYGISKIKKHKENKA